MFGVLPDAVLIALGNSALRAAMQLSGEMRAAGLRVELLSPERGLKALLRRAGKIEAHYAVIIGEDEISRGVVQVRDLRQSVQQEVSRTDVVVQIAGNVASSPRSPNEESPTQ